MRIINNLEELRQIVGTIGDTAFVPTMGNLHDGHIALVHQAKRTGAPVIVSIFVNPLQFGQGEDFERYPRTFAADAERLLAAKCDFLFMPDVSVIYPEPQTFQIQPPLADELCGAFRPGHFSGVCTVVMKLFEMVRPRFAIFGKKDYQQLFLIKGMVKQFNLPIDILESETARASSGLALSSRNGYLTQEELIEAPRLYTVLNQIALNIRAGNRDFEQLTTLAGDSLRQTGWRVDYVSVRARTTLLAPKADDSKLVILAAAWLNKTRLIDNLEVDMVV